MGEGEFELGGGSITTAFDDPEEKSIGEAAVSGMIGEAIRPGEPNEGEFGIGTEAHALGGIKFEHDAELERKLKVSMLMCLLHCQPSLSSSSWILSKDGRFDDFSCQHISISSLRG